jgi:large subunit ribosomal protein L24
MNTLVLKKGDEVLVVRGKDRGQKGKVLRTIPAEGRVVVEGVNMRKKHVRARKQGEKGQLVSVPSPLSASNVRIVCASCGKMTRIGYRVENGKKTRVCKKCGHVLA